MAPSPDKNPKETDLTEDTTMDDDDKTVVAESNASKTDFIEAEMMDLNVRYEISFRNGHSNDDDFKLHVKLLLAMTQAFDKSTLRIYNNKNKRVKSFAEPKWQDKEYFNDHFTIHTVESQRKTLIVHRIMTNKSISAIKTDTAVIKHLKKTNMYLRGHFWKEDEVLLKGIGFFLKYVPPKQ
jgi:hypothetical protein